MVELRLRKLENGLDPKKTSFFIEKPCRKIEENGTKYISFSSDALDRVAARSLDYFFKGVVCGKGRILIPAKYFYI